MSADQSFARLLQLGKQQGGLTPHDLQQVLDVERLSTDELSDMLVRLDQAGVSVEIDPALLAPASGRAGLARRPDNSLTEGHKMPFKPCGLGALISCRPAGVPRSAWVSFTVANATPSWLSM